MKSIKYSKLTNDQKEVVTTIIGFGNNIPTTYAKIRPNTGWDVMQHSDKSKLSKNKKLITISIENSIKDVMALFSQYNLIPYCPIGRHVNIQLEKQLNEEKKNRRNFPRKKINLNGEYFHIRTRSRGSFRTKDISLRGLKFTSKFLYNIALGDKFIVNFVLKDARKSKIIREIKTKYINEKQIGAEIINPPPLDPDLGFYLMK